ncbi:MAG TPA: cell division protein FtsZ [Spirochaetota bacterium]|nr:cell division protein FtsZ [Spirochaetota bacterium]HPP04197.1 cell division protein FtsZ [Spirochaetota bacterium]
MQTSNINFYETNTACTRIVVVGVGGGGCNSINRMIEAGIRGVEFIAVNTDKQALQNCKATRKIVIGEKLTGGRGAGAMPEIGRDAAEESKELIQDALKGANMVFIAAGMGGGTGTGAAPVIAKIAKSLDILTVAVVTKPFDFEKKRKGAIAEEGINNLRKECDTVITISNQALLNSDEDITLIEAWRRADDVLKQGVQGISDLIVNPGEINIDFADVKTIMANKGIALMGVGIGKGENASVDAVTMAIENPLMPELFVNNAKSILVNVAGSSKMKLKSFSDVMKFIENIASDDALIIVGQSFDDSLEDRVKVTIIATEFDSQKENNKIKRTPNDIEIKSDSEEIQKEVQKKEENNLKVYPYQDFIKLTQPGLKIKDDKSFDNIEEPAFLRRQKMMFKDKDSEEGKNYLSKKS